MEIHMLSEIQYFCSEGKNMACMRDHDICMGMGWMGGWYFGAPYWFYNLRRSCKEKLQGEVVVYL
jgi:hypothetical protein